MYKIPLFDLNFDEAEERAVIETIKSQWISTGPRCAEFESRFAEMLGAKYAASTSNCTAALHMALLSSGVHENDEVICPSLTFVATANAVRYVNAVPVFADVTGCDDLTIDPADIEKKITGRTRAVIVMHYGGFACDMESILNIAAKYDLIVIEDACHAPLGEYKGKKLGTIGDIGCFSFFSNKNISTGEGGMMITDNEAYFEKSKLIRSHGMTSLSYERSKGHSTGYDVVALGYNYRMDDIRASIGIAQLRKLAADIRKRADIRKTYVDCLKDIPDIIIPFQASNDPSSNYIFPIVLRNSDYLKRNRLRDKMAEAGIQTSIHYPAVHRFSIYKAYYTDLPVTDYVADNLITLPMYGSLSESDIGYISKCLETGLAHV